MKIPKNYTFNFLYNAQKHGRHVHEKQFTESRQLPLKVNFWFHFFPPPETLNLKNIMSPSWTT